MHKSSSRLLILMLILTAAALLFSACGTDPAESTTTVPTGTTAVPVLPYDGPGLVSRVFVYDGEEKSIVTDIRGTTRDIVEVSVRFAGTVLRLYDTAGIRESSDTVEAIGIARAKQKIEQARLVLAVFDSSDALDETTAG